MLNLFKYYSDPKTLNGWSRRYHIIPGMATEAATRYTKPDDISIEELEDIISKSPEESFYYARELSIEGRTDAKVRFKKGEPAILTSPRYSYEYARNIIHGRWKDGESIIATDPWFSWAYAEYVLDDRFELGEPAILAGPEDKLWEYNRHLRRHGYQPIGE